VLKEDNIQRRFIANDLSKREGEKSFLHTAETGKNKGGEQNEKKLSMLVENKMSTVRGGRGERKTPV